MRMAVDSSIQRISRLTPLAAILALIEARVVAVKPERSSVAAALGCTLAESVVVRSKQPPRRIALRDGYAVDSMSLADAGPYSPLPLAALPPRVDAGEALPDGMDAIAPLDAVAIHGQRAEAIAAVGPGEGVL